MDGPPALHPFPAAVRCSEGLGVVSEPCNYPVALPQSRPTFVGRAHVVWLMPLRDRLLLAQVIVASLTEGGRSACQRQGPAQRSRQKAPTWALREVLLPVVLTPLLAGLLGIPARAVPKGRRSVLHAHCQRLARSCCLSRRALHRGLHPTSWSLTPSFQVASAQSGGRRRGPPSKQGRWPSGTVSQTLQCAPGGPSSLGARTSAR